MNNNPLLSEFNTPHGTPPFDLIKNEHYKPAFEIAIQEGKEDIDKIVNCTDDATFENTILALEHAADKLGTVANIFFNLSSADTNSEMQEIANEVAPLLSNFNNDIWLNADLFKRVKEVYDNSLTKELTAEQRKLIEETYKNFTRSGALLSDEEQEIYRKNSSELAQLSLKFEQNLLAETNNYILNIEDKDKLSGIPEDILNMAAETAKQQGKEGWVFTLHFPSYVPFLKYADNRELRKEMFLAYSSRGNNGNEYDNNEIVKKIVNLRLSQANLLGYKTYAEYALENKMAESPSTVNNFLTELLNESLPYAKKDIEEVESYAKNQGFKGDLQRWDLSYYSEKLKSERYSVNDELVRPYFKLENVQAGIFKLANSLWGLTFKENNDIPVYNKQAKAYEVYDADGSFLSVLYLDFFPRESKSGGAWMTNYREQCIENNKNIEPIVSLVCNFSPPSGNKPSLLTFGEVQTFLHEFGHGLHGMLSNVNYKSFSGTNVKRDFVELPSQLLENWACEKEWLKTVGKHYETGETIPDELVDKIMSAKNFQSGYLSVRQISFGMDDMAWHSITQPYNGSVNEFEEKAMAPTELFPKVEGTAFGTAFAHIFAGGYAAGYYGYKWAEVLDADAFSMFKNKGIYDKETAQSYRENILEKGGSEAPMQLYVKFRGQEPTVDALLEREGFKK